MSGTASMTPSMSPRDSPFGHGLSYTTYSYNGLSLEVKEAEVRVGFEVTNTGSRTGAEVPQVYVAAPESSVPRPAQELSAFSKLWLRPGETHRVSLDLPRETFAFWDTDQGAWAVEPGTYEIRVGASSRDIRLTGDVAIESADEFTAPAGTTDPVATDAEFAGLLGGEIPAARGILPYTTDSTINDLRNTWLGRRLRTVLLKQVAKQIPEGGQELQAMLDAVVGSMPLRALAVSSEGRLSLEALDKVITTLNALSPTARRAARRG